ncbi:MULTISPECIES: hypothetical protein [Deefgea]|uniref:Uncharacterized protein n=1 Tax=Deefgea chitinilytica TaxID=570276 RepID=A0ABS2C8Z4_9NEIS|nr:MULTISPECIES: hypothetical protein [Deefgea]MBM5570502.1 hypothetical protein [Deefgea chitinilytica]MBM9887731.1 hypothetical protein [Deefgea sp. CFH1-16]
MTQVALFDVDVLRVPGRYWLTIAEAEEAPAVINALAKMANELEPGSLGVLEAKPVLINNLRAWENLILPRWYHQAGSLHEYEQDFAELLQLMALDADKLLLLMSKLPSQMDLAQRRVVALLRVVMQRASTWIIEEEWLDWWADGRGRNPLLAKMYPHIVLPASVVVLSTRAAQKTFQSINLLVDAQV